MLQKIKDPYLFQKKEIKGVPIYINKLPWSPCVYISIGFKVGALEDPIGKEGVAHFLEHMIFNGSPLYPDKHAVREFSKKYMMGSLNAFTSFWNTEYYGKTLPEHFEETIKGIFDLVFNPILDEKESSRERNVIIQESWDKFNNKKHKNYGKWLMKNVRPNLESKRIWRALGWPETISKISSDDIKKFQKKYNSGSMYIFLVGAVEEKHIKLTEELIKKTARRAKRKEYSRYISVERPKIKDRTFKAEDIGLKQDHATISLITNTSRNPKIEDILVIAEDFIWELFFEILREEMGLCYGVDVSIGSWMDFVHNSISLNLNKKKIKEAEEKIFEIFSQIQKGKYQNKFEEEKRISIEKLKAAERTSSHIISNAANQLIYYDQIFTLKKVIEGMQKVNFDEVATYLTKTFKREKIYLERIIP